MKTLTEEEIRDALASHPGWAHEDGRLVRELAFGDFSGAWAFMSQVALAAEKLDHHPDWSNVYDKVRISLWTHDARGITRKDLALVERIDRALER